MVSLSFVINSVSDTSVLNIHFNSDSHRSKTVPTEMVRSHRRWDACNSRSFLYRIYLRLKYPSNLFSYRTWPSEG